MSDFSIKGVQQTNYEIVNTLSNWDTSRNALLKNGISQASVENFDAFISSHDSSYLPPTLLAEIRAIKDPQQETLTDFLAGLLQKVQDVENNKG